MSSIKGSHFTDSTFSCVSLNDRYFISVKWQTRPVYLQSMSQKVDQHKREQIVNIPSHTRWQPVTKPETHLQNNLIWNINTIQESSTATCLIRYSQRRSPGQNIVLCVISYTLLLCIYSVLTISYLIITSNNRCKTTRVRKGQATIGVTAIDMIPAIYG